MEPLVDTVIEDPRWLVFGLDALAESAVRAVFADLALGTDDFNLCLMGCDDARISALNVGFRGRPGPTNVLSWPSKNRAAAVPGGPPKQPRAKRDGAQSLGDIAISYDTCMRESQGSGMEPRDHICHLIVHGVLHLLGYDHIVDADATLMEAIEVRILATLGVSDPYC